jgi:hypothetical protein
MKSSSKAIEGKEQLLEYYQNEDIISEEAQSVELSQQSGSSAPRYLIPKEEIAPPSRLQL